MTHKWLHHTPTIVLARGVFHEHGISHTFASDRLWSKADRAWVQNTGCEVRLFCWMDQLATFPKSQLLSSWARSTNTICPKAWHLAAGCYELQEKLQKVLNGNFVSNWKKRSFLNCNLGKKRHVTKSIVFCAHVTSGALWTRHKPAKSITLYKRVCQKSQHWIYTCHFICSPALR